MKTIGSGNWIIDNLNSALAMWNERLSEIWQLITTSPESFKGGGIWAVIVNINDGLKAVGYALLVLFFVMGVVKTCGSFAEMKKPEMAFKCFIRFVLAQAAVSWGMELMTGAFRVAQGMVTTIIDSSGLTAMSATALPDEMVGIIEDVGFIESIPLWAVTLLGSLFIWVLSLVMILTVYSRFFKLTYPHSAPRRIKRQAPCFQDLRVVPPDILVVAGRLAHAQLADGLLDDLLAGVVHIRRFRGLGGLLRLLFRLCGLLVPV